MKTPQEILAEWADPETGGTMPKEVREAALSVLHDAEYWKEEARRFCVNADYWLTSAKTSEARVKELEKQRDNMMSAFKRYAAHASQLASLMGMGGMVSKP